MGVTLDRVLEQLPLSSGFWLSLASGQKIGGRVGKEVGNGSSRSLSVGSLWAGCSSQPDVAGSAGQTLYSALSPSGFQ